MVPSIDPVSLALNGASLLGGIFGNKRKHIDPEYLRQHFGPKAVADNATELSNYILNSPYGQQLMSNAAESGQNFQTEMAAKAANAGLDPSSGGQSGAGDFATSAASQAENGLQRNARTSIYQSALPIAEGQVNADRSAYLGDLQNGGYTDDRARQWQQIGNAAGFAASQMGPGQTPGTPQTAPQAAGSVPVASNGQPTVIAKGNTPLAAPAGTVNYGFGGAPQPLPGAGNAYLRKVNARRLGMSQAMVGQNLVNPVQ